jgi:hypothetical protein
MRAGLILEPGDRLADRRERPTSGLLPVSEDDLKPLSQIHEIRGVDLARVEAIHSYEGWNSSQIAMFVGAWIMLLIVIARKRCMLGN